MSYPIISKLLEYTQRGKRERAYFSEVGDSYKAFISTRFISLKIKNFCDSTGLIEDIVKLILKYVVDREGDIPRYWKLYKGSEICHKADRDFIAEYDVKHPCKILRYDTYDGVITDLLKTDNFLVHSISLATEDTERLGLKIRNQILNKIDEKLIDGEEVIKQFSDKLNSYRRKHLESYKYNRYTDKDGRYMDKYCDEDKLFFTFHRDHMSQIYSELYTECMRSFYEDLEIDDDYIDHRLRLSYEERAIPPHGYSDSHSRINTGYGLDRGRRGLIIGNSMDIKYNKKLIILDMMKKLGCDFVDKSLKYDPNQ